MSETREDRIAQIESRLDYGAYKHSSIDDRLAVLWLIGELRSASQDTERLDWREAHPKHGFGLYADGKWADGKGGSHDTYREAIDTARKDEGD